MTMPPHRTPDTGYRPIGAHGRPCIGHRQRPRWNDLDRRLRSFGSPVTYVSMECDGCLRVVHQDYTVVPTPPCARRRPVPVGDVA